MIINSTEFQNNVGKFLQHAEKEDIIIMKNGKEVARLIGANKSVSYLSDALLGILPKDFNEKQAKQDFLNEKYGK